MLQMSLTFAIKAWAFRTPYFERFKAKHKIQPNQFQQDSLEAYVNEIWEALISNVHSLLTTF